MKIERHPATDIIHAKIIDLLEAWLQRGYSLEKIGEICGVAHTMIHGLLKSPGQPGYKGSRLTLNTAIKIWTGLGNTLESLFIDCEGVYESKPSSVDLVQVMELEKQTLEFDQKILEAALQKRVSPKKHEQILILLAAIKSLIDDITNVLDRNRLGE